jgi:hypothetical protein
MGNNGIIIGNLLPNVIIHGKAHPVKAKREFFDLTQPL